MKFDVVAELLSSNIQSIFSKRSAQKFRLHFWWDQIIKIRCKWMHAFRYFYSPFFAHTWHKTNGASWVDNIKNNWMEEWPSICLYNCFAIRIIIKFTLIWISKMSMGKWHPNLHLALMINWNISQNTPNCNASTFRTSYQYEESKWKRSITYLCPAEYHEKVNTFIVDDEL